jgi:hypothetical protein
MNPHLSVQPVPQEKARATVSQNARRGKKIESGIFSHGRTMPLYLRRPRSALALTIRSALVLTIPLFSHGPGFGMHRGKIENCTSYNNYNLSVEKTPLQSCIFTDPFHNGRKHILRKQ